MIELTPTQWSSIRTQLCRDYPLSVMLIRSTMQRELGFVPRFHQHWVDPDTDDDEFHGRYQDTVYLDFYDDAKETFFRLKYLNNEQ